VAAAEAFGSDPTGAVRLVRMKYARFRLSHRAVVTAFAEVDLVSDTWALSLDLLSRVRAAFDCVRQGVNQTKTLP